MDTDFSILTGKPPVLCVDFDGVIHWYRNGYHDGTIYDEPTPGAQDAIRKYMEHFTVVIYSARANTTEGAYAIQQWLRVHDFPDVPVVSVKPPAFVTIDDRAVTFTGIWPSVHLLQKFEVWTGAKWGSK